MGTPALSISSHGGGSYGTNIVGGLYAINFIDTQFIDLVKGRLSYDSTVEGKCNSDSLLKIITNILTSAIALVRRDKKAQTTPVPASEAIIPSYISHLINWISCQMTCEATRCKNLRDSLSKIFDKLSSYQWTTQVLLVLAAFAVHYGDFWYLSEDPSDVGGGNALSTCLLKGLSSLKKKLRSDENVNAAVICLNDVVDDLLKLTKSLVDLYKLLNQHRGRHVPGLANAFRDIPKWSCETIIAIVVAGNYFAWLVDVDDKFPESELGNLGSSVSRTKGSVLTAVDMCNCQIARMKEYQDFVMKVEAPVDIVHFLKLLLAVKDSSQDVFVNGLDMTPATLESFRKKKGLLIISDLEISVGDVATLEGIRNDLKQPQTVKETPYELVWIPIEKKMPPDNLEAPQNFKSLMPWAYKVDPCKLNELAVRYIRTEWLFRRETMVVVVDSHGWLENLHAMPMLRIWGTSALERIPSDQFNWFELVIRPMVTQKELNEMKTDYSLVYGGAAATELEHDIGHIIPELRVVHIKDTEAFFIRLRSCLISRMEIVKTEMNPLSDSIVCEMCEAYRACQIGGFTILIKGPDLHTQHVGLFHAASTLRDDLMRVKNQVADDRGMDLAEAFKKKEPGVQEELSGCKHVYVPHYPGLGDLRCPDCDRFVGYDVGFTCFHSGSHQGGAPHTQFSAVAIAS